jgi:rhodanese-related sulfurtransferase
MILKRFYDEKLAQASYLVGCAATGEALVVDPIRDVEQFVAAADAEGLRITHITETHIHADFVSGARELAERTGATLYLSDEGDANWKYAFASAYDAVLLRDGDFFMVGNVRIDVRNSSEWEESRIPRSRNFPLGRLTETLQQIPRDKPLVVHCQSGGRAAVAIGVMQANGFHDVSHLSGGFAEWRKQQRPVERGAAGPAAAPAPSPPEPAAGVIASQGGVGDVVPDPEHWRDE